LTAKPAEYIEQTFVARAVELTRYVVEQQDLEAITKKRRVVIATLPRTFVDSCP
jgi:hypothetical protein